MNKWTNQQKLLNIGGIIGAAPAVIILGKAAKMGVDKTIKLLNLADQVGIDRLIGAAENMANVGKKVIEFKKVV